MAWSSCKSLPANSESVTPKQTELGGTNVLPERPRNRFRRRAHRNPRQPNPNPPSAIWDLSLVEQPPTFCQRSPRTQRAGVDQTADDIAAAHQIGVCQHLQQILSMPLLPVRTLLLPPALLEFFPVPFVFRINDERPPVQLQDHVGDETVEQSLEPRQHHKGEYPRRHPPFRALEQWTRCGDTIPILFVFFFMTAPRTERRQAKATTVLVIVCS
jgi:hypothetical protein